MVHTLVHPTPIPYTVRASEGGATNFFSSFLPSFIHTRQRTYAQFLNQTQVRDPPFLLSAHMRVVVTVIITTRISAIVINMHICVYTGTIVYNVYVCKFLVGWYTRTQCNVGKQLRMGCEQARTEKK